MFASTAPFVRSTVDTETGICRLHHDPGSSWPISTTVVFAISSLTGLSPTAMRPLHHAVDGDVLDRHVDGIRDRPAVISFEFHGYEVTVRGDGQIEFVPLDAGTGAVGLDADAEQR